jgi:hypothetical protein
MLGHFAHELHNLPRILGIDDSHTRAARSFRPRSALCHYRQRRFGRNRTNVWSYPGVVQNDAAAPGAIQNRVGNQSLSREPYPFPDIWGPLARVFDAWGFDRCLWGTDWTRAYAVVNYAQAVEPFLKTDRLKRFACLSATFAEVQDCQAMNSARPNPCS